MECYICLEAVDSTSKSPCKCGIPIHDSCFIRMYEASRQRHCTVCKQEFSIFNEYSVLEEGTADVQNDNMTSDNEDDELANINLSFIDTDKTCRRRFRIVIGTLLVYTVLYMTYACTGSFEIACQPINPYLTVMLFFFSLLISMTCCAI